MEILNYSAGEKISCHYLSLTYLSCLNQINVNKLVTVIETAYSVELRSGRNCPN